MDFATFQEATNKIDEAKKVFTKALAKEQKAREAHNDAKAELKKAEEGYKKALEEAQGIVSPQEKPKASPPAE